MQLNGGGQIQMRPGSRDKYTRLVVLVRLHNRAQPGAQV